MHRWPGLSNRSLQRAQGCRQVLSHIVSCAFAKSLAKAAHASLEHTHTHTHTHTEDKHTHTHTHTHTRKTSTQHARPALEMVNGTYTQELCMRRCQQGNDALSPKVDMGCPALIYSWCCVALLRSHLQRLVSTF
eukprot:6457914-Amphidinium_carterae.1